LSDPNRQPPLRPGRRAIAALGGNRTGPLAFGHFCAEVPKSLHIGAYPRVLLIADRLPRRNETPASGHIRWPPASKTGLIAMQKVEGSNPFSRFL
jgi:hypothetical protein